MKKFLDEAVGVPEGIIDSAKKLYAQVINQIGTKGFDEPITQDVKEQFKFNTNIKIVNLNIVSVDLNVYLEFHDVDKIFFTQAGFASQTNIDYGEFKFIKNNNVGFSEFKLKFALPEGKEFTTDDILNFIALNEEETVSTLAHELKHAYDEYVLGYETITDRVNYASITKFHGFGLPSIRNFFHYLYLATNAEIVVKPTEIASRMEHNQINKKEFLSFLLKDKTYNEFKYMSEITFEKFYQEILEDEDRIIHLFERSNIEVPESTTELINNLFNYLYVEFINNKLDILKDVLTENISEHILGLQGPKHEYFVRTMKKFTKYKNNPEDFFNNEIKYLNFIGNKMLKRLSKLYSIANEDFKESNIINKINNKVNHGKR